MARSVSCENDDVLQRIVELNNQAVAMLEFGDLRSSGNGFKDALKLSIALLDDAPCPITCHGDAAQFLQLQHSSGSKTCWGTPDGRHNEEVQPNFQLPLSTYNFMNLSPDVSFDRRTREAFNLNLCEGTFIENTFVRALNLVPSNFAYSEDPLSNSAVVSCIILFNIAIVHHRFAILQEQTGCSDIAHIHFRKAQSLYFKARSLLADAGISMAGSKGQAVIDVLNLAMYNNLGQSSFYLADYSLSQEWFSQLVTYASTVTTVMYDSNTADILELHKTIFQLNAITFRPPTTAAAA